MAFSNVFKRKYELPGGYVIEHGTFNGAAVTTGTITCDATIQPEIGQVIRACAGNDADNVTAIALDAGAAKVKLTFTTSDTGTYTIVGKAR